MVVSNRRLVWLHLRWARRVVGLLEFDGFEWQLRESRRSRLSYLVPGRADASGVRASESHGVVLPLPAVVGARAERYCNQLGAGTPVGLSAAVPKVHC